MNRPGSLVARRVRLRMRLRLRTRAGNLRQRSCVDLYRGCTHVVARYELNLIETPNANGSFGGLATFSTRTRSAGNALALFLGIGGLAFWDSTYAGRLVLNSS